MSVYPTPFTVGVHTYSSSSLDDYNREVGTWTPLLDAPGVPREVYGWAAPSSTEPKLAGHDRVAVEVELLVPPGFVCGPHDVIDLPPSGQFEVIGYPEDFTHGPFGFAPGAVVNLRRTEG